MLLLLLLLSFVHLPGLLFGPELLLLLIEEIIVYIC